MDIDMHYYGTYAMARAAGIRADCALRIATAAEFVDDSTLTDVIVHPDGARFRGEPTAHHPTELVPINNLDDQQRVKDATFSSTSPTQHLVRVGLGALAGGVIGLGWVDVGLTASTWLATQLSPFLQ